MKDHPEITDAAPEISPPPPGPNETPLPPVPPPSGWNLVTMPTEPAPAKSPDIDLELAVLHELDEAAQEAYVIYADKLFEHGELQCTPWAGLNEALRSAWRSAVKHVRSQEEIDNGSR